ncbi:MAG: DNA primase [Gammaproteobacteria bacterium]|nr:DNA primase [Gammaproteobacteria bacterium]
MSTRIPQSFLDELITRTDIVELINSYVPLKKKGKEFMACCPFHNEKTPSFTVSQDKQFYYCFGCEAHGTALGFLMEYERLDFLEAVETLAQRAGLEIPRDRTTPEQQAYRELFGLLEQAHAHFMDMLSRNPAAGGYLKKRGLSDEIITRFGLGYAQDRFDGLLNRLRQAAPEGLLMKSGLFKRNERGMYDLFRNRVMFPIRDRRGRVIGFGGRVLDDAVPKYLNSPETPVFRKGEVLYGMHEARKAREAQKRVLVVEGYMDVLALAQHGMENTVATLGTATTTPHIQQLYRYTEEIVFCFDGDAAGRRAAWRAAEQTIPVFRDGLEARFLFLPQGEDPDSLVRSQGKAALDEKMKESVPLSTFLFEKLGEDTDTESPAGKARLAQQARPLLERFPDGVFKRLVFEELEKRVGTPLLREPDRGGIPPAKKFGLTDALTRATPVRLAISALLHEPALAQEVTSLELLQKSAIPGVALLARVITIWKQEPGLGHAALIERFHGQPEAHQLQKLLTWKSPRLQDPGQAFGDALNWICKKTRSARIQELIEKEKGAGLDEAEKQEFRDLLHRKPP